MTIGLKGITACGDNWDPHLTLAVEPVEATTILRPVARDFSLPPATGAGHLVLGLAGPNGQYRGILAGFDELNANVVPPYVLSRRMQRIVEPS